MNDPLINEIAPYAPGSNFNPLPSTADLDPKVIQATIDEMVEEMGQLSGAAAINFYMGTLAPEQMLLQQAFVEQFSNQLDEMTNYTYFFSMMQQEIDLSKPGNEDYNDYTENLKAQIEQLLQVIPSDTRISSDQKEGFIEPLRSIQEVLNGKTLPEIWNEATQPINPNDKDLTTILKGNNQLSTVANTISSTAESSTKYAMGEYNRFASLLKNIIKTNDSSADGIIKHLKI